MKTAEEAAAEFLCKLQAAIDLSEYKDGEVNLLVQGFKKGFESGKAEGFESRQGEIDVLKDDIRQLEAAILSWEKHSMENE